MKTKILLTILLACAIALSISVMSSTAVYADANMKEINITGVAEPTNGATPNANYSIPSDVRYVKTSSAWYASDSVPTTVEEVKAGTQMSSSDTFSDGTYYTFLATVTGMYPIDNFYHSPWAYINDNAASVNVNLTDHQAEVWLTYRCGEGIVSDTAITAIDITGVAPPIDGETASTAYAGLENLPIDSATAMWVVTDSVPTGIDDLKDPSKVLAENAVFEVDKYYTFMVGVTAEQGYSVYSHCTATVNGAAAQFYRYDASSGYAYYTYQCELPSYIVTVTADGNGTAVADKPTAKAGEEVTLTATPNSERHFKEWQIISGDIEVMDDKFTMPDSNVEVKAIFDAEHTFDSGTHECICGASNHTFDATHICACGAIEVNEHTFPNEIFRNHILGKPYGEDGVLTPAEIAEVKTIGIRNQGISDLTGIEHFTAITMLLATNNKLTTLDISNNKELSTLTLLDNQLTSLDVSANTKLTQLNVSNNKLTSLNVGTNTLLEFIDCSNNYLTSLDLSANTLITTFDGGGQKADITVMSDMLIYNMSAFDNGFDGNKATVSTSGGSFSGNLLVLTQNVEAVTYTYATGLTDKDLTVTLSTAYAEQAQAREVEFRKGTDHIQWRYAGEDDSAWKSLIAISEITGAAGSNGENGREIELQIAADGKTLQWRYENGTWANLFDLSALKGADGANGDDGKDGDEIELRKGEAHIEWKYKTEADTEWKPLVSLDSLKGDKGDKGDTGAAGTDGIDGDSPYVGENGNWWVGNTDTGISASGNGTPNTADTEGVDGVTVASISIGSAALLGNLGWGVFFIGKRKKWF